MGFTMPHVLILVGAALVGVALLLQIVGVATTNWLVQEGELHIGLWEYCPGDTCFDIDSPPDYLQACRAFGILAVLVMVGSLVCAILCCFMSGVKILPLAAGACAAAGAFCSLIEFAVYLGELESAARDYLDYSFALTIVACLLSIVAAIVFFLGHKKSALA